MSDTESRPMVTQNFFPRYEDLFFLQAQPVSSAILLFFHVFVDDLQ